MDCQENIYKQPAVKKEKSVSDIYDFKLEKKFCTTAEVLLVIRVPSGQKML